MSSAKWRPFWTNSIEILISIQTFSFKKMHLKMSYAKWRPFCLCLNVNTLDVLMASSGPRKLTKIIDIQRNYNI